MPKSEAGGNENFGAYPYSIEQLCELFAKCARTTARAVRGKQHRGYFEEYFKHLHAKTIVVEASYTDRHFLEDHAGYYDRCFGLEHSRYPSRCSRLHFFDIAFDSAGLGDAIACASGALSETELDDAYLGFIVVKPLPETFVGRTCLKVYDDEPRRKYPVIHPHEVHLAGLRLSVKSLAFQEQDQVAAACATSALWSMFQQTGQVFHHHVPSPLEITRSATEIMTEGSVRWSGRDVPSSGLTPAQMAGAIKKVGLVPELVNVELGTEDDGSTLDDIPSASALQAVTYGYLKSGIPILLNAALYDISSRTVTKHGEPQFLGGHAVTVTGYSTGLMSCIPFGQSGTLFESSKIDKLYVHDDGVGPFARLTLNAKPLHIPKAEGRWRSVILNSSWCAEDEPPGSVVFAAEMLVLPLYHKIRIPAIAIRKRVLVIDSELEERRKLAPDVLSERLVWDVFLTTENKFKEEVRALGSLSRERRCELLENPLPRFIWRAIATHKGERFFEALYDATDIEQGDYRLEYIVYDRKRFNELLAP